ncbi:uncharacterized protein DDB_G0283697 isoform X1 [Photinus pyralis]|uniref:uncharacterized protein DDB_G0283697 isoform X1 n=1 Tax=Photinus pyralis TaxID=7054 RepID=UPI001267458A|nr:uncharacterized protein DDB_G0283697 isoform X1 [Photinus pyralis]XP_031328546.1 uncharacterized protein DDB_G0283697 isoform X1 [Photinus pyralis]
MPDVTRSDSQRSDGSNRPRVSFNRDVHVKRIVPNETSRVAGSLGNEATGHLLPSPVRKERLPKSKLAEEAARVLKEVEKVNCVVKNQGVHPDKFYTLPARRKHKVLPDSNQSSLDRTVRRRRSEELGVTIESPPKKPPRTFTQYPKTEKSRNSIFNVFKKSDPSSKSSLRRSVSDATNLKSKRVLLTNNADTSRRRRDSDGEDSSNLKTKLSPIIESAPSNDYFSRDNKENIDTEHAEDSQRKKGSSSVTELLKEYIDEVDTALFNETGTRVNHSAKFPEVVIIDVDKAEKITRKKDSKLSIGKKIKSLGTKKVKTKKPAEASIVKDAIDSLQNQSPTMIHSSQKPVDKLPLTRGFTVDTMVRRLNSDKTSPSPPKTNIMVTPNVSMQHNNNQPFSYTRGQSPERNYRSPEGSRSPDPGSPIIYAHVVCDKSLNNSNTIKQTVHAAYTNGKKHLPHSDSDEGLGNDEGSGISRGKYDYEKPVTHFGDDYYRPSDPYQNDEENPITPKMKNGYNHYNNYKTEHRIFIDSSSRGRGDGMDSKRRESLTEPHENGFNSLKYNNNTSRTDLSARRDLLESRINRRLEEKHLRHSPPSNEPNVHVNNQYVSETKYYRHGSSSPVGYTETYVTKSKTDRNGNTQTTKTHSRKDHRYSAEPKSIDSQIIDYRSSPENVSRRNELNHDYRYSRSSKYVTRDEKQKLSKDREHYRSNPEIIQRNYNNNYDGYQETYHDSLKRETSTPKQRSERKYFDRSDSDRKDRLGDSGIENDFKRSSGHYRRRRGDYNDSEDEGFASSLLIASERQHTEDNINTRSRDDSFRNLEHMDYKVYRGRNEYAPRERSIDDGSHYDPRIDKDFDADRSTLKKKVEKKPPKPEKKSGLEKVKQLFSRDSKKKKEKERAMVPEESLRARYTEYRGSRENLEPKSVRKHASESKTSYEYSNRRRLSTPSPSPTREVQRNGKSESTPGSWFKSIDRLSRKKSKKDEKVALSEDEIAPKPTPTKNLRFFGDTDVESNDSLRHKPTKTHSSITNSNYSERVRSQSNRDLQNISEERQTPEYSTPLKSSNHRSLLNISESERDSKNSRVSVKPPISPSHRPREHHGHDDRGRRRRNEVSSVESSTEGDSSQQSQRSVVYLHAATVGDIPGPGYLRNGRRAASREELASNGSSNIKPQTKTLSRSFSVLAPWKPRHYKESYDIDYTQYPKVAKNGKYEQRISKNSNSRKDGSSTLKKKANETKRSNQSSSTLNRRSQSKENVSYTLRKSQEDLGKGSSMTLYRKKDKQPKENLRYAKDKEDKRISSKSISVESLSNHRSAENGRDISRSVSMPRDPEKSAGWFKSNKKSKKSVSSQRL